MPTPDTLGARWVAPAPVPEAPRTRALELVGAFVVAVALAALATALDGWPPPRVFDEFSLILAGDTFASGRLTNPPHPLPHFFETIHVLQRPTYSSKYFPGHGLFLALGIVLGGGARLGQWIAFATMGPALLWMLQAWTTRRRAVVATAITLLLLADTPWASGYWGAALAVTGSALIFGAFRRLIRVPDVTHAVLLAVGVTLVAFTRPFEGAALCIPLAIFFTGWLLTPSAERRDRLRRVAVPATLVLAAAAIFLLVHNRAVTGDPLRSGYAAYEAGAPGAPPFVWQEPVGSARTLRVNEQVRMQIDRGAYRSLRSWWSREMRIRLLQQTIPYFLPHALFAAVLLVTPFSVRDWRLALVAGSVLTVAAATGISSYFLPHYIAPALAPLLLLYLGAIDRLNAVTLRGWPIGRVAALVLVTTLGALGVHRLTSRGQDETELASPQHWSSRREALVRQLHGIPGRHLVFVRYGETYRAQDEWVQNRADLAGSRVLWAHDLGAAENARLLAMEGSRRPWLLTLERPSVAPAVLVPYGTSGPALPLLPDTTRGRSIATPPY